MRTTAMVLTAAGNLDQQTFEVPEGLGEHEALLELEGTGICGTDVEQVAGELEHILGSALPLIPGHEPVGRIVRLGSEASRLWPVRVGDRVAVEPYAACAICRYCTVGESNLCPRRFVYGFTPASVGCGLWGSYAEHMVLRPNTVVHRLPEYLTTAEALLFNALAAGIDWAYGVAGTRMGDAVLILGCGQRGLMSVVAAREAGADLIIATGLARDRHKLALARELGATATINVDEEDTVARVRDLTGGLLVDRAVDASAAATQPIVDAIECVRPGGTVVLAGIKGSRAVTRIHSDRIMIKGVTLRGAVGVRSWAYARAVQILASRRYDFSPLHSHSFRLTEVQVALSTLAGRAGTDAVQVTVENAERRRGG